jgi:hypothetical protein
MQKVYSTFVPKVISPFLSNTFDLDTEDDSDVDESLDISNRLILSNKTHLSFDFKLESTKHALCSTDIPDFPLHGYKKSHFITNLVQRKNYTVTFTANQSVKIRLGSCVVDDLRIHRHNVTNPLDLKITPSRSNKSDNGLGVGDTQSGISWDKLSWTIPHGISNHTLSINNMSTRCTWRFRFEIMTHDGKVTSFMHDQVFQVVPRTQVSCKRKMDDEIETYLEPYKINYIKL